MQFQEILIIINTDSTALNAVLLTFSKNAAHSFVRIQEGKRAASRFPGSENRYICQTYLSTGYYVIFCSKNRIVYDVPLQEQHHFGTLIQEVLRVEFLFSDPEKKEQCDLFFANWYGGTV